MEDLKKCPFCGGEAKVEKRNYGYQVRCQKCGARGKYSKDSRDESIEKWNRRIEDAYTAN